MSLFDEIKQNGDAWFTEIIGKPNGSPVAIRVMNDVTAPFHTHEKAGEMYIVLSGRVFIDTDIGTQEIASGHAHTVRAGTRHRARVEGRAELIVIGGN